MPGPAVAPSNSAIDFPITAATVTATTDYARITGGFLPRAFPSSFANGGIRVATISDPAGNHIGLIENPHLQRPAAADSP